MQYNSQHHSNNLRPTNCCSLFKQPGLSSLFVIAIKGSFHTAKLGHISSHSSCCPGYLPPRFMLYAAAGKAYTSKTVQVKILALLCKMTKPPGAPRRRSHPLSPLSRLSSSHCGPAHTVPCEWSCLLTRARKNPTKQP